MKNVKTKSAPAKKTVAKKNTVASRTAAKKTVTPAKAMSKTVVTPNIGLRAAIRDFFARYFVFNGISTRAQYWWVALFNFLVLAFLGFGVPGIAVMVLESGVTGGGVFLGMLGLACMTVGGLFGFAIIIPTIALWARRVHDAGFSAWVLFVPWIVVAMTRLVLPDTISNVLSFMVSAWGLALALMPSKVENNPYRE